MRPGPWLVLVGVPLLLLLLPLLAVGGGGGVSAQKTDVPFVCPERCVCPKKRAGDKFTRVKCGGVPDKPVMYLNEIPFTNFTDVTSL